MVDTSRDDGQLLGARFADGRTGAAPGQWSSAPIPDDEFALVIGAAGGSDRAVDAAYFLTPLPPPITLTLSCVWPRVAIHRHTGLDASVVPEHLARVLRLWT